MTGSSYKTKLGKLLADVRTEEQTLWDALSDEERNAAGEIDHWAPKNHLAHATFWTERRLVTQLQAATGGEPPGSIEDYQKTNDEVYETNKDRSWEDVLAWAEEVSRQVQTAFDTVSEEMLADPERPEGTGKALKRCRSALPRGWPRWMIAMPGREGRSITWPASLHFTTNPSKRLLCSRQP